jgi:hypothetical protein
MVTFLLVGGAVLLAAVLVVLGRAFFRNYLRFHGDSVISCPENQCAAGVRVDAVHAGLSGIHGAADLRLESCTRWPERQDCGQECLRQIEAAPENCLVRSILTRWYHGKNCALCGKPIGEIDWAEHKPGLLSPEHKTVQWWEVPAETVPSVLAAYQPVCWNCHIVNRLMTEHPELVVDRSRPA